MPLNNALYIQLLQSAADARYNGGIYIAGQSETDAANSEWTTAFFNTQVQAFINLLTQPVNAVGGDSGQWTFATRSKAYAPAATPIGTLFDITGGAASQRVMTMRKRGTKVRGLMT